MSGFFKVFFAVLVWGTENVFDDVALPEVEFPSSYNVPRLNGRELVMAPGYLAFVGGFHSFTFLFLKS